MKIVSGKSLRKVSSTLWIFARNGSFLEFLTRVRSNPHTERLKRRSPTITAPNILSGHPVYIYAHAHLSSNEKLPSASARAHKCPDPSTKHIRTHMTAKANKERALATSNAATASACAPLYVSQGRHVRLRTTYLYLCCFVHDRPDARTFPSAEIGRPASRVSRRFTERPNPSFLLSSGSSPRRVMAHWLIDWTLLRSDDLTLDSFYSRIRVMLIFD